MKRAAFFDMKRAAFKGLLLFLVIALALPWLPSPQGLSLYGWLVPARPRLPFGENPSQAYNFSLYSLPAMFAAHEVQARHNGAQAEFRVFVLGDSSVWGLLLRPEETLSGQLNRMEPSLCGKPAHFYNLGYPTLSLTKDLLLLEYAARYQPDAILWLTTLEAFPLEKQLASPLAANNAVSINRLIEKYRLPLGALPLPTYPQSTLFGQRRALADWIRLQLYAIPWAATGIDQFYPTQYAAPQTNFAAGQTDFHSLQPPLEASALAYEVLRAGMEHSPAPVWLINEPMLLSQGENSALRYNFFYPRWAYDAYLQQISAQAREQGWQYLDLWNILPASDFTNSAIHLTPAGEQKLARAILDNFHPACLNQP